MTATPIETHYAGHRFRSRLEARWAVFLDRLGIKWQYEPQGYLVGKDRRPCLPDFLLPELNAFVEVKGESERLDIKLLADLAMSSPDVPYVVVLGDVPVAETGKVPTHAAFTPAIDVRLDDGPPVDVATRAFAAIDSLSGEDRAAVNEVMGHKERWTVVAQRVVFLAGGRGGSGFFPVGPLNTLWAKDDILNPQTIWPVLPMPQVKAAYHAARTARFEHGETPIYRGAA